jgi:hypothetical protein
MKDLPMIGFDADRERVHEGPARDRHGGPTGRGSMKALQVIGFGADRERFDEGLADDRL